MNWRSPAIAGGAVAIAAFVWFGSAGPLERVGLGDFDPLDRICLVILVLSVTEAMIGRFNRHETEHRAEKRNASRERDANPPHISQ
jgi:hypothetical protein